MYNAYNYNPYMQQNRYVQQPLQQPLQNTAEFNRIMLNGKQVDSIDMAKTIEYPLDGSISYYPITDGSAIVTKQMMLDGTPKLVIFKPIEEQKEQIKYITQEDMKKALDSIDLSELDDIKDEIKDLKSELKDLKKKGKINNE